MKCHYEVLDIPRDADDSLIKSAYKKMALKWHPDKNLDTPDEAKEQFQFVQQAYEVLSDRQERAWYDAHRNQILLGSQADFEDKNLDVFPYFTTTCFKGYGNDENGFYQVYGKVFESIAKEDLDHMDDKEEFCNIPLFGNFDSDYDTIVHSFYGYWMTYSTKKSYVWLDPHETRTIRERRIFKLVEKENKKVRAKAKKERNEEIRNLVAFVRKRDKRVQANIKRLEEKVQENRERQMEINKQKRLEKHKHNLEHVQGEWTNFDNVQNQLEEIEKNLEREFGKDSSDYESEDDTENLICAACNKLFKTPKAFQNHESSKKHRENVQRLKLFMSREDSTADPTDDNLSDDIETKEFSPEVRAKVNTDLPSLHVDNKENDILNLKKKGKKTETRKSSSPCSDPSILSTNESVEIENDDFDFSLKSSKRKSAKAAKKAEKSISTPTPQVKPEENSASNLKSKRKKEKIKKSSEDTDILDNDHICIVCKFEFVSKNKLFDHLKTSGHSTYLPSKIKK